MLRMAKTTRKPKVNWETRVPSSTTFEVRGRYNREVGRQADDRKVKFFGAAVTKEAITNAILLHFLDLSEGERDAIFDRYMTAVEGLVAISKLDGKKPVEPVVPPIRMTPGEKTRLAPKGKGKGTG